MEPDNRKTGPAKDLQVRASNGVVYRIPAAELRDFEVPPEQQYFTPTRQAGTCVDLGEMIIHSGRPDEMAAMRPTAFLRLVHFAIETGIEAKIASVFGADVYRVSLPSDVVRELHGLLGNQDKKLLQKLMPTQGQAYVRLTLLALGKILRGVMRAKKFETAMGLFRPLDSEFLFSLSVGASREVKFIVRDATKTLALTPVQAAIAKAILVSECDCGGGQRPPPPPPPDPNCDGNTGIMGCPS